MIQMKKTVYILLHTLAVGGAERHATSIANYLSANGYSVTILLLDNQTINYDLEKDIVVYCLSKAPFGEKEVSRKTRIVLKALRVLSKTRFEEKDKFLCLNKQYIEKLELFFQTREDLAHSIVISFMTYPNLCAAIAKKKFHYKLILAEFTSPQLEFAPDAPENRLKKKCFPAADGFIFQTKEQEAFYTYLPNVRKEIIPNPIEEILVQPYYGTRRKEIVNFCRLSRAKNLPLLIESFARLSRDYPDYTLVIYGEGPLYQETQRCIEEHGVAEHAILKPFDTNVLERVKDCAMFVSSSDREGISNSMLEAMAIGLPVICTDCPAGGARMFIESYYNGILVPVRDVDAMHHAMKYLIDHPDEAGTMGKNAMQIRETLKKDKILRRWQEFIETV